MQALFLLIGQCKLACIFINNQTQMHKNWFQGVLKVKEAKPAIQILEKQCFHEENSS